MLVFSSYIPQLIEIKSHSEIYTTTLVDDKLGALLTGDLADGTSVAS